MINLIGKFHLLNSEKGCELNRSMQHLSLKMKAEDVAYGQAPTTKILL
jgi:hypothetical protein